MHKLHNKQSTNRCYSAEGEFEFTSLRGRGNKLCVCRGWQQMRVHLPQPTVRLVIRGAAVADAAEGVAGLQLGLLAVWGGLSFLPLAEELLERLELACLFLVCRRQDRAARRTPRQQAQRRNEVKERGTSPEQPGSRPGNAGLLLALHASHRHCRGSSVTASALGLKDGHGAASAAKRLHGQKGPFCKARE